MTKRNADPKEAAEPVLRALTPAEHRQLSSRLKDLSLTVRVHQRYRVIEEIRKGRSVGDASEHAGCDPTLALGLIERFNRSGFSRFERTPKARVAFLIPPATE